MVALAQLQTCTALLEGKRPLERLHVRTAALVLAAGAERHDARDQRAVAVDRLVRQARVRVVADDQASRGHASERAAVEPCQCLRQVVHRHVAVRARHREARGGALGDACTGLAPHRGALGGREEWRARLVDELVAGKWARVAHAQRQLADLVRGCGHSHRHCHRRTLKSERLRQLSLRDVIGSVGAEPVSIGAAAAESRSRHCAADGSAASSRQHHHQCSRQHHHRSLPAGTVATELLRTRSLGGPKVDATRRPQPEHTNYLTRHAALQSRTVTANPNCTNFQGSPDAVHVTEARDGLILRMTTPERRGRRAGTRTTVLFWMGSKRATIHPTYCAHLRATL
eukprot:scaffold54585_cov71-Phaeocystis_antarctica.AAC.3